MSCAVPFVCRYCEVCERGVICMLIIYLSVIRMMRSTCNKKVLFWHPQIACFVVSGKPSGIVPMTRKWADAAQAACDDGPDIYKLYKRRIPFIVLWHLIKLLPIRRSFLNVVSLSSRSSSQYSYDVESDAVMPAHEWIVSQQ